MTPAEVWPTPPSCPDCVDWHAGYEAGYLAGDRDARAELAATRLEQQRRIAEQMEPAATVIAGIKAAQARQDARLTTERRPAA
ncbi:hypothetical protein [Nesterenkonia marinintestina]|uniref:hypothetical protein n=1 Tax=Nesterenkonia marinintestina TaxID=2979865 RepID=UPI0021C11E3B|nr:hypothetical protein [Nesterenkonia sp. GX14115]